MFWHKEVKICREANTNGTGTLKTYIFKLQQRFTNVQADVSVVSVKTS